MPDAALEALWKNVLDHWEDDKAHGAFLEHCQRSEQLVEAAVRYRGMKGDRERGPIAEKRLAAVAMLSLAQLESIRTRQPPPPRRTLGFALILFFLVASILMLAYLRSTM